MRRRTVLGGLAGLASAASAFPWATHAKQRLLVFAAASLKTAIEDVTGHWVREGKPPPRLSFAGSSALARQIQYGAPADLFISANAAWMDALDRENLIRANTRRDILRNRLVLIAHGGRHPPMTLSDLPARLGEQRLAMALVDAVPAGIYGKQALTTLGLWPTLAGKVAQADNVRAALALVARGEAPYGIVYATDAAATDNVQVAAMFPTGSHPEIVYPAAVTTASRNDEAGLFLDFLVGTAARAVFARHGFLSTS